MCNYPKKNSEMNRKNAKNSKKTKSDGRCAKIYDDKLTQELDEAIEEITNSGKKTLEDTHLRIINNACKYSDKYVKEAYDFVIEKLKKNHAEIRRSAFQICDHIFRNYHCFRELVVWNLEEVVKLTTSQNLPPPIKVARELRQYALCCIHEWNTTFGRSYKKLEICYRYLQRVEKIDFKSLLEGSSNQRQQEDCNPRVTNVNQIRKNKALAEFKEKKPGIKETVTSLTNCINLLLPHPDEFFIPMDEEEEEGKEVKPLPKVESSNVDSDSDDSLASADDAHLREVGMVNPHHSLQLDFIPDSEACIQETCENADIIENVREYAKVIQNKYLPTVKTWLEILSKHPGNEEELKDLLDLKGEIDDVLFKFGRMVFTSAGDVSSDSELEEVPALPEPKPGRASSALSGSQDVVVHVCDNESKPSTSVVAGSSSSGSSADRKQRLLTVAPKLPYDVDLYHWEDDKLPVPKLLPSSTDSNFWVGSEASIDELPVPEGSSALRTRVIEFTGSFKPVAHSCRVRLPSGKLCPRRDRFKCPFHGEIVPRDEAGNCLNPKDAMRIQELREKQQLEKPDWQNPKLLADIKKATGVDLKMPVKGKRTKKKSLTGLTDLKASENTVKKRLEKKVFKKSVMKRVSAEMDRMDHRRFRDKYGDQFNYFYDK